MHEKIAKSTRNIFRLKIRILCNVMQSVHSHMYSLTSKQSSEIFHQKKISEGKKPILSDSHRKIVKGHTCTFLHSNDWQSFANTPVPDALVVLSQTKTAKIPINFSSSIHECCRAKNGLFFKNMRRRGQKFNRLISLYVTPYALTRN